QRFGFILRYPPDKAAITGYANEPWHLRYVGTELAGELFTSGQTMEERFGLVPG
ncbi:MAG: D-alanyl-D-alanine carboxypeptidase family protein, partial [Ilumatobacteraceae bacterium]